MTALFRLIPIRAWLIAGVLAILLAAAWWAHGVYRDGQQAKADLKATQARLESVQAQLEVERARTAIDMSVVDNSADEARAIQDALAAKTETTYRPEDDAPLAPVLRDALRRLQ